MSLKWIKRLAHEKLQLGLAIGSGLLGVGTLAAAAHIPDTHSLWHELVRDIGIAFIVSFLIGTIYELSARNKYEWESRRGIIGLLMGDFAGTEIWNTLRSHVFDKKVLRRHLVVRVRYNQPGQANATRLWLQIQYDVYALRSATKGFEIDHVLDKHLRIPEVGPPQFLSVRIDGNECDLTGNPDGTFRKKVRLHHVDGQPQPLNVAVTREEVVYVPGSYNLVMTELTRGVEFYLLGLPPELICSAVIWPSVESIELQRDVAVCRDVLLLPGQVIELRCQPKPAELTPARARPAPLPAGQPAP